MSYPSKEEILASSKGWVASFLNFFPGLGSGYLYQRRWYKKQSLCDTKKKRTIRGKSTKVTTKGTCKL